MSCMEHEAQVHCVHQCMLKRAWRHYRSLSAGVSIKKRATPVGCRADPSLVELVRGLAETLADGEIARILNMKKLTTPRDLIY